MHILIVEDEVKTAVHLKKGLAELSIVSDIAENGIDGLALATKNTYALILLDVMLPGVSGFEVIRRLRDSGKKTPVIFLTALDEVFDRVNGLRLGADDYLVKPFAFSELAARIQAVLRRGQHLQPDAIQVADLEVNFFAHKAIRGGRRLDLTPKELALISLLACHRGEVFSRRRIAEHIWNMDFDSDTKVVDVHIRNLRAKVDDPFEKKLIHAVRGVGYVLEER